MLSDEDYLRVGNKIDSLRNSRNLPSRIEEKEISDKGLIEQIGPVIYQTVPESADELMKRFERSFEDILINQSNQMQGFFRLIYIIYFRQHIFN